LSIELILVLTQFSESNTYVSFLTGSYFIYLVAKRDVFS
jgi:hypothetical protein